MKLLLWTALIYYATSTLMANDMEVESFSSPLPAPCKQSLLNEQLMGINITEEV